MLSCLRHAQSGAFSVLVTQASVSRSGCKGWGPGCPRLMSKPTLRSLTTEWRHILPEQHAREGQDGVRWERALIRPGAGRETSGGGMFTPNTFNLISVVSTWSLQCPQHRLWRETDCPGFAPGFLFAWLSSFLGSLHEPAIPRGRSFSLTPQFAFSFL